MKKTREVCFFKTENKKITDLSFEVPDEYDRLGKDEEHVDEEDRMEVKDQAVEIVAHLKKSIDKLSK